jgi:hypothetical protein
MLINSRCVPFGSQPPAPILLGQSGLGKLVRFEPFETPAFRNKNITASVRFEFQ